MCHFDFREKLGEKMITECREEKESSGVNRRKETDLKLCPAYLRQYFQGQHDCQSLFMVKN